MSSGLAILEERFPQLSFLLNLMEGEPWALCDNGKNGTKKGSFLYREGEVDETLAKLRLDEIEVLYVYGMGLGHHALPLLE